MQLSDIKKPGLITPHSAISARYKLWTSMRIMRHFTAADLAATADVSKSTAVAYLHPLTRAGYVRRIGTVGGHRPSGYRLMRNTGPAAPRDWRLRHMMYDVNTGEVIDYA